MFWPSKNFSRLLSIYLHKSDARNYHFKKVRGNDIELDQNEPICKNSNYPCRKQEINNPKLEKTAWYAKICFA